MTSLISNSENVSVLHQELPLTYDFGQGIQVDNFPQWFLENKNTLESNLLEAGAVLFTGLDIESMEKFESLMNRINPTPLNYVNGNSPRTKLTEKVYTSTEYDATQRITLHNELSYSASWPSKLFFCCIAPALKGGETPIADSRKILEAMNKDLVDEIEKKKIKYIRNLHGGTGFGPSWQQTFETQDKNFVERFCVENKMNFQWKKNGGLKLIHVSDGINRHPVTHEKVWFNQVDQFHPVHLSREIFDSLLMIYDRESELPTYVTFGDDSLITEDMVTEIRKTVDAKAVIKPWAKGNLLWIDNVLVCHGRMPYSGYRKVLVSMC